MKSLHPHEKNKHAGSGKPSWKILHIYTYGGADQITHAVYICMRSIIRYNARFFGREERNRLWSAEFGSESFNQSPAREAVINGAGRD